MDKEIILFTRAVARGFLTDWAWGKEGRWRKKNDPVEFRGENLHFYLIYLLLRKWNKGKFGPFSL